MEGYPLAGKNRGKGREKWEKQGRASEKRNQMIGITRTNVDEVFTGNQNKCFHVQHGLLVVLPLRGAP